jgi:hypothetical protein
MRMPWWKTKNYDLYAFLFALIGASAYILFFAIQYVMALLPIKKLKQKTA